MPKIDLGHNVQMDVVPALFEPMLVKMTRQRMTLHG